MTNFYKNLIIGIAIKDFKTHNATAHLFEIIIRNEKRIKIYQNHPLYSKAVREETQTTKEPECQNLSLLSILTLMMYKIQTLLNSLQFSLSMVIINLNLI